MKVVILAGGYGTRISEESCLKPKPMIEIGGMPILWHIMKNFSEQGFNDFIICAGYKQELIKQWFANYYLQDLDHYIKEELKVKYYIRYMDDMVLFSNNKKELRKCKYAIDEFLAREHLRIKENWQLFKTDSRPIDFLGYRFYRGYTTLRRSNFLRIKRRIKKISKKEELNFKDACAIMSYNGWIIHSDSYNYTQKYLKPYVDF